MAFHVGCKISKTPIKTELDAIEHEGGRIYSIYIYYLSLSIPKEFGQIIMRK